MDAFAGVRGTEGPNVSHLEDALLSRFHAVGMEVTDGGDRYIRHIQQHVQLRDAADTETEHCEAYGFAKLVQFYGKFLPFILIYF